MDSSHLTGWPKPPVGRLGTTEIQRPSKLRLKAPVLGAPESTVKGRGRGNSRGR